MGENTLRALASDLAYLEAWALAATGNPLPWPAPEALAVKFVAHHLWDPARRETDPRHGMPADVAATLRARDCCARRPARARDRAPAPRQLVDPAPMARPARPFKSPGLRRRSGLRCAPARGRGRGKAERR